MSSYTPKTALTKDQGSKRQYTTIYSVFRYALRIKYYDMANLLADTYPEFKLWQTWMSTIHVDPASSEL